MIGKKVEELLERFDKEKIGAPQGAYMRTSCTPKIKDAISMLDL